MSMTRAMTWVDDLADAKDKRKNWKKVVSLQNNKKKDEKEKNAKKKFASFLKGREKKEGNGFFFHEICPNV